MRTPFLFLEWIGLNAMLVFVMAAQGIFAGFINGWYYKNPDNNLVSSGVSYISQKSINKRTSTNSLK